MDKHELFKLAAETIISSGCSDGVVIIGFSGNPILATAYVSGNDEKHRLIAEQIIEKLKENPSTCEREALSVAFQEQRLNHDLMLSLLRKVIDGDFKCDSTLLKKAAAIFNEVSDN